MHNLRVTGLCIIALLTVAACKKETPQTVVLTPVLKSVQVESNTVIVSDNGPAEIIFSVEVKDFSFDLKKDVTLFPETDAVTLTQVRSLGEGRYVAVLSDSGKGEDYEHSLRLGVREKAGADSFVFSS